MTSPKAHRHKDSRGLWGSMSDTPVDTDLAGRVTGLEEWRATFPNEPTTTPPPVTPPPPVLPPPTGIEVPTGKFAQAYADAKNGDVLLLHGGVHNSPFIVLKKKITVQNWPGEVPELTVAGRPDILYFETDGVARGLRFRSQSTGFNDSQGAALSETRSPTSNIGLVWYDECEFLGTSKMATREQLLYLRDMGQVMQEIRITGGVMDMAGGGGYGIHPYAGPSPKLITATNVAFRHFRVNAAVTNWANACLVKVDHCSFLDVVTVARGEYGPVQVSNSWGQVAKPFMGKVDDLGGNDWARAA